MNESERFGEIRSVLHQEGTRESWQRLCSLLDLCAPNELSDRVMPYARAHLGRWPEHIRSAPRAWCATLATTEPTPLLELAHRFALVPTRTTREDTPQRHLELAGLIDAAIPIRPRALEIEGEVSAEEIGALVHTPTLLEELTALTVRDSTLGDPLAGLLANALPESLAELGLFRNAITHRGVTMLATSANLSRLETLRLEHNLPGPRSAEVLLEATWRESMRDFGIGAPPLSSTGAALGWGSVELLAADRFFDAMTTIALPGNQMVGAGSTDLDLFPGARALDLSFNHMGDRGLARVLAGSNTESLSSLTLSDNRLGAEGIHAITRAGLDGLEHLDLRGNALGFEGVERLLGAKSLGVLKRLNLGATQLERGDLVEVKEWSLAALEELSLAHTQVDDGDVYTIAREPSLTNLTRLDLRSTRMTGRGARAIATSDSLDNLTHLYLSDCMLGDQGVMALVDAALPSLRVLHLRRCSLGDRSARALAEASWLGQLEELDISKNAITEDGRHALYRARSLPHALREIIRPVVP